MARGRSLATGEIDQFSPAGPPSSRESGRRRMAAGRGVARAGAETLRAGKVGLGDHWRRLATMATIGTQRFRD